MNQHLTHPPILKRFKIFSNHLFLTLSSLVTGVTSSSGSSSSPCTTAWWSMIPRFWSHSLTFKRKTTVNPTLPQLYFILNKKINSPALVFHGFLQWWHVSSMQSVNKIHVKLSLLTATWTAVQGIQKQSESVKSKSGNESHNRQFFIQLWILVRLFN